MADNTLENNFELRNAAEHTEIRRARSSSASRTRIENHDEHSLPPCDGGTAAWRLLLAAFVFEALLWGSFQDMTIRKSTQPLTPLPGFPLSFGIFQDYYSKLPKFKDDPYISVIGSTASGISYLAAPIMIPVIRRFSKYRRRMIWIGWPICLLALVAGSFADSLGFLIFTQGIMYGLGFIIFYYPILSMVNEYWIVRRGMAYGLLCSASGLSGTAMPFCVQALLQRYGYPTTLRAIAVGLFVLTGPLLPMLKGRLPTADAAATRRIDWSFFRAPLFWVYSTSNLAMGLGYFFPSLYLPSYATSNGLTPIHGALLLAMMSVSQVLGQLSFGYLSDRRLPLDLFTTTSVLMAATAAYLCWGLGHNFNILVVFALMYGFFGAGYTAMWARMGTAVSDEPTAAFAVFGLLNLGKGIGNVLAGPLSGALLLNGVHAQSYGSGNYQPVILFTGSCMLLSSVIIALWHVRTLKHIL